MRILSPPAMQRESPCYNLSDWFNGTAEREDEGTMNLKNILSRPEFFRCKIVPQQCRRNRWPSYAIECHRSHKDIFSRVRSLFRDVPFHQRRPRPIGGRFIGEEQQAPAEGRKVPLIPILGRDFEELVFGTVIEPGAGRVGADRSGRRMAHTEGVYARRW